MCFKYQTRFVSQWNECEFMQEFLLNYIQKDRYFQRKFTRKEILRKDMRCKIVTGHLFLFMYVVSWEKYSPQGSLRSVLWCHSFRKEFLFMMKLIMSSADDDLHVSWVAFEMIWQACFCCRNEVHLTCKVDSLFFVVNFPSNHSDHH